MKSKLLDTLKHSVAKLKSIEIKIADKKAKAGYSRLAVFLAGVVSFFIAFFSFSNHAAVVVFIIFLLPFFYMSIRQSRIIGFHEKIKKVIEIKESYIKRIELDWPNIHSKKFENNRSFTEIEIDLDLFGPHSLHHLIDFSKSLEGSIFLRDLLGKHDLNYTEIINRQNIVKELRTMNRFRDKFLIISALVSKKDLNSKRIFDWIKVSSETKSIKSVLAILLILMGFNLAFISLDLLNVAPGLWVFSYFVYVGYYFLSNGRIKNLAADSDLLKDELGKYSKILEFAENYNFGENKYTAQLCEPLREKGHSPSQKLNRIIKVVNLLTLRANPFIWGFFIAIGPIDYFLAYLIEKYRKQISERFPVWMNVWHKLEAFISLGTFAYLNPEYTFPSISRDELNFNGKNLGHVLIPYEKKVSNNFKFNTAGEFYIITGSNMSGKSTFLRTLGINVALAYAGGPVSAEEFHVSLFKIFTCIKVSDSVIDGISYFYAEVKRLKKLLTVLEEKKGMPVLFLIDEIFKGTNNIERRIGSRAYLKSLIGSNAVGIVSTHDIELAKLGDEYPQMKNFHFREEVKNDKMIFDYKLRGGACPTTNALKIMRLEGLPVDDND